MSLPASPVRDARHLQIGALSLLLVANLAIVDMGVTPLQAVVTILSTLAMQYALFRRDWRSALVTGLSLSLLLRTHEPVLWVLAPAIAIGAKRFVRINGKQLFNPANIAIVTLLLLARDDVWVSPGQWGTAAWLALTIVCAAALVLNRAARWDTAAAFALTYGGLLVARCLRLGDPLTIPLHQVQSGALLIFTAFMITDPRSTPNHRVGRLIFAGCVAYLAYWLAFTAQRREALFYALAAVSLLTPLLDRLLAAPRFTWRPDMIRAACLLLALMLPGTAFAFCGFYVAKADTGLFNKASKVVLARKDDRTVITMVSDVSGDAKDFAVVIPVPTFLEKGQIHVAENAVVDHLDAYTAPRLVEYFDDDPCRPVLRSMAVPAPMGAAMKAERAASDSALGVKVEASYAVGEYDILILAASESDGLVTWLERNGYKMPPGAGPVVGSYLKQGMHFFVAKVNLERHAESGATFLRPIQVAYESPKFMLPIRLGTVNAAGPQELFVLTLTSRGRVETTNYRTQRIPSGQDLPLYVKEQFGPFYRAMFDQAAKREDERAVFTEYAWDTGWCDPCAADPLSADELRTLGVWWSEEAGSAPGPIRKRGPIAAPSGGVFATRLHMRYTAAGWPEDLALQETSDRENFQGRYVLRHAFTGDLACESAERYRKEVADRQDREATTLASLTGWEIADIRAKMAASGEVPPKLGKGKWYETLWPPGK